MSKTLLGIDVHWFVDTSSMLKESTMINEPVAAFTSPPTTTTLSSSNAQAHGFFEWGIPTVPTRLTSSHYVGTPVRGKKGSLHHQNYTHPILWI